MATSRKDDLIAEVGEALASFLTSKTPEAVIKKLRDLADSTGMGLETILRFAKNGVKLAIRDEKIREPLEGAITGLLEKTEKGVAAATAKLPTNLIQAYAGLDETSVAAFQATLQELLPDGTIRMSERGREILRKGKTADISAESLKKIMLIPDPTARREVLENAVETAPKTSTLLTGWMKDLPEPVKKFLTDAIADVMGFFDDDSGQSHKFTASLRASAVASGNEARLRRERRGF